MGGEKTKNQTMKVSELDENENNYLIGSSVILYRACNANNFHFTTLGRRILTFTGNLKKSC